MCIAHNTQTVGRGYSLAEAEACRARAMRCDAMRALATILKCAIANNKSHSSGFSRNVGGDGGDGGVGIDSSKIPIAVEKLRCIRGFFRVCVCVFVYTYVYTYVYVVCV